MRKLGEYLLANPLHAMAASLLCALLPMVYLPGSFLAGIVVGLVTLSRGYKSGFIVLTGAAIPVLINLFWKPSFSVDMVFMRCVMVWLIAGIFRHTVSWRLVLEVLTLIGILAVLGFYLFLDDVSAWWFKLSIHYQPILSDILSGQISEDKMQALIAQIIPIATGLFIASLLLGIFCQLVIARFWQAALFRPGGFAKEFVEIRCGLILAALLTLTVITALFGLAFAIDLLPVVILPLAIAGLSLVHKWFRCNKKIIFLLAGVYAGLIFLPAILIVGLALAGYVDSYYDLRRHYLTKL